MCESRTAAMRWSGSCLAATKNLVDDLLDRCRRVDDNSVLGDVGFCLMPSHDEFAIRRLSAAPLIVGSLVEPPIQGVEVDVEDEDAVEELDECREVPGTTAEECDLFTLVRDQGPYCGDIPDVVLVAATLDRLPSFRVALVGQLAVAMDGVVAAPLQLLANGGLAGAGEAFDQVVPPAHLLDNTRQERQHASPDQMEGRHADHNTVQGTGQGAPSRSGRDRGRGGRPPGTAGGRDHPSSGRPAGDDP